jgi:hypothetical protein
LESVSSAISKTLIIHKGNNMKSSAIMKTVNLVSHSNENYTTPFQPYTLYTSPTSVNFSRTFTLKHTMLTEYLSSIRVAVTTKRWKLGHDRKLQQHLLSKIDFQVSPSFELSLTPFMILVLRLKLLTLHKNIGKKHKIHSSRRKTQEHLTL